MAKLSEKIGYALGDAAAGGITWKIMSVAFPFFFTNVFGLSLADTALLMLIARMFDVVTDPIMGSIADRTQSRWGTYRPWLIFGAIPYGLCFALLFFTPELGPMGKRIYAYSLYLMMMVLYTAVNVPYGSLLGVMSEDADDRNQFSAFRMVGAYAMGFITLMCFSKVLSWGGDDTAAGLTPSEIQAVQQHQYALAGALFGIIAAVMTLACGLLTRERIAPKRTEKFEFKQFVDLFKNKPWIYITLTGFCTNFFNGFRYAVAAYMVSYCLGGDVNIGFMMVTYTSLMAFGEVTCMIFGALSPAFTRWVGSKRMAFVWAAVFCCVTSILFFFIPQDPAYIWLIIAMVVVTSIGAGIYSPLLWSMYADVADYATEKFGSSSTGLIFSSGTMAQKFGGAISGALITILLGVAGASMIEDEMGNQMMDPNSITESVKTMVWALFSLFPAVCAFFMGWLAYRFPIKK